jgi:SAM-dependent methyltransferase
MDLLASTIRGNKRLSRALTPTHVHEANVFGAYRKLGALLLSHPDVHRVIDCGAGRQWHFPSYYKRWYNIHLIGLDIDGGEMVGNGDLDESYECDVTKAIPIPEDSADLVMVSSGVEHFSDNEQFLKNVFRVLRPNGFFIAQFPGRYAPFAIINRMLPKTASRLLIDVSMSEDAHALGFKAYYDRTNYSAFSKIVNETGFNTLYYLPGYYSSSYADFAFPIWIFSYMYDVMRFGLGVKNASSYNLFILQKPGDTPDLEPLKLYAWDGWH